MKRSNAKSLTTITEPTRTATEEAEPTRSWLTKYIRTLSDETQTHFRFNVYVNEVITWFRFPVADTRIECDMLKFDMRRTEFKAVALQYISCVEKDGVPSKAIFKSKLNGITNEKLERTKKKEYRKQSQDLAEKLTAKRLEA